MALQLIEGFDHFNSVALAALKGWTFADSSGAGWFPPSWTTGRITGGAFRTQVFVVTGSGQSFYMRKPVPGAPTTFTCGFAFRVNTLPKSPDQCHIYAGANAAAALVFAVQIGWDGTLNVYGGISGFASSTANLIRPNVWNYIEVTVNAAGASSTVEAHLNGVPVIASSTVNCGTTPLAAIGPYCAENNKWIDTADGTTHPLLDYDDLYVTDTTGGINVGYLGDVHVDTLLPIGDGANTAWTPDSGTAHYPRVSDNPPDGDTSYVSSSTVGAKDTYAFADLPAASGPVYGVQVNLWARKDDAAVRQLRPVVRIAGTDYLGPTAFVMASSFADYAQLYDKSPASSAAWTPSEVNAAEFGVEVDA